MIPNNITKKDIIQALEDIDRFGVPKNRDSTKYNLKYKGKSYPPKYVISIANKYANKTELEPSEFGGGNETNSFLINLGFEVFEKKENIVESNLFDKVNLKKEVINNHKNNSKEKTNNKNIKKNIKKNEDKLTIATVINSIEDYDIYYEDLYQEIIRDLSKKIDIILFPAGYFSYNNPYNYSKEIEEYLVDEIASILK